MNLYLLTQDENYGYDTYDSIVVCCETVQEALRTSPCNGDYVEWNEELRCWQYSWGEKGCVSNNDTWANKLSHIKWTLLGSANDSIPKGVVCSSFNAG